MSVVCVLTILRGVEGTLMRSPGGCAYPRPGAVAFWFDLDLLVQ
jgi:hypothetical protein